MAWKKPPAELVKPLFDLNQPQEFLLRPLTGSEKSAINHWVQFYKLKASNGSQSISLYGPEFCKLLVNRWGFSTSEISATSIPKNALFQNLFKYAPHLTAMSALARITGLPTRPSEEEKRLAFRETVEMYRAQHGQDHLPRMQDFIAFHDARTFLPNVGLLALDPRAYKQYKNKSISSHSTKDMYRFYFDVPAEISEELLNENFDKKAPPKVQELVENYKNVYDWMFENNPNRPRNSFPTYLDIGLYAEEKGGISWSTYQDWLYGPNPEKYGKLPNGIRPSFEFLYKQCGVDIERKPLRRQHPKPKGYWTRYKMQEAFFVAWQHLNPDGFKPKERKLSDPPSSLDLKRLVQVQALIIQEHGHLVPEECKKLNVPAVELPSASTIQIFYPGGFQKMLRDIEDKLLPMGGIKFSNRRQLTRLKVAYEKSGLEPTDVPRAVTNYRSPRAVKGRAR